MPRSLQVALVAVLCWLTIPVSPPAGAAALRATLALPVAQQPESARVTLADLGYADRTVTAADGILAYRLPVRPAVVPDDGGTLTIRYLASPLLDEAASGMTVVVDGRPRDSVRLAAGASEGDDARSLDIPLPNDGFDGGPGQAYDIELRITLRTAGDATATGPDAARWLTVLAASSFSLDLVLVPDRLDLAHLPAAFVPPVSAPGLTSGQPPVARVTVTVSSAANPVELEAAGLVALALGRWATERGATIDVALATDVPADGPTVTVATGSRFPSGTVWGEVTLDPLSGFSTPEGPLPAGAGILTLFPSVAPQLLVTGTTPEAVLDAARALADPDRAAALAGPYAVVTGRIVPGASPAVAPWDGGAATLAGLGQPDVASRGDGEHLLTFRMRYPSGWVVRDDASLTLDMSATGIAPGSTVAVAVNGASLGRADLLPGSSATPTASPTPDAPSRALTFPIPRSATADPPPGALLLEVTFDLRGDPPIVPAVTLLATSRWDLPHDDATALDLARYPWPLLGEPVAPLVVVLPNDPATDEIAAGLAVMAGLGASLAERPAPLPRLTTAGRLNRQDRDLADLAVIAVPERNELAAALARQRPEIYAAPDPPIVADGADPGIGRATILRSPWNGSATIVAITADRTSQLLATSALFESPAGWARLGGRQVALSGDLPPQVTLAGEPDQPGPAGDTTFRDRWGPLIVIGAVAAFLLASTPLAGRAARSAVPVQRHRTPPPRRSRPDDV